jgi:P-type Cu+ transporter
MNDLTKTKKESYLIEGMTCSGCERTVQKVVTNLKGVSDAQADLESASVSLEYDPQIVSIDEIKAAVNKVGYKITDMKAPAGRREGSDEGIS